MPSLEEAVEDLRSQIQIPPYNPDHSNDRLGRDAAFHAGQLWAITQLNKTVRKYGKESK
tara:strand:- start:992 stop:1168 length:177 start_codon:yes stop_codon:yes gene_type:complete